MWFRTVGNVTYYVVALVVYRCWDDGLVLKTDLSPFLVQEICDRIDAPTWGAKSLKNIEKIS